MKSLDFGVFAVLPLNEIFEIVDGIVPYIISLPIGKLVCPYLLHTKVLVPA
jgi:hypothetical protein